MARRLALFGLGLVLGAFAFAQSTQLLTRFGPVNGILVGTAGSPVTRAALASDIETLISPLPVVNGGTGATSLSAAHVPTIVGTPVTGNCVNWATAATLGDTGSPCGSGGGGSGTVTSVSLAVPTGLAVTGSPCTVACTLAITGSVLTQIGQTVASGTPATMTVSSIPVGFTNLQIIVTGRGNTAAASATLLVQFNGDSSADYDNQGQQSFNATVQSFQNLGQTSANMGFVSAATATANRAAINALIVSDYLSTTFDKVGTGTSATATASTSGTVFTQQSTVIWRPATPAAITSVTVSLSTGNFVNGSKITVYGLP